MARTALYFTVRAPLKDASQPYLPDLEVALSVWMADVVLADASHCCKSIFPLNLPLFGGPASVKGRKWTTLKATLIKVHEDSRRQTRTHGGGGKDKWLKNKAVSYKRTSFRLAAGPSFQFFKCLFLFSSQSCPLLWFTSFLRHCEEVDGLFLCWWGELMLY